MAVRLKSGDDNTQLLHRLGERVKELTALHQTARLLQDDSRPTEALIADVLAILPPAWQFPEVAGARIFFREFDIRSENFRRTAWVQSSLFTTRESHAGGIEICYLEARPEAFEGPFLAEERNLIDSLAEMLRSYFQQTTALESAQQACDDLEAKVRLRTEQLQKVNQSLEQQVAEYRRAQEKIESYQRQLRKLASELSLSEARQRRAIARDLHDQIGQALAFIRMRVTRFQGDAVFCGFENTISEILTLLDQAINSTRSLTFEISPPILYELGLSAAFEWLAEQLAKKHSLSVQVKADTTVDRLPDDFRIELFKAVQELLVNVVKHAHTNKARLKAEVLDGRAVVTVSDSGLGFDVDNVSETGVDGMTFGLFSIRERLGYLGGSMTIASQPGRGTTVTLSVPVNSDSGDH